MKGKEKRQASRFYLWIHWGFFFFRPTPAMGILATGEFIPHSLKWWHTPGFVVGWGGGGGGGGCVFTVRRYRLPLCSCLVWPLPPVSDIPLTTTHAPGHRPSLVSAGNIFCLSLSEVALPVLHSQLLARLHCFTIHCVNGPYRCPSKDGETGVNSRRIRGTRPVPWSASSRRCIETSLCVLLLWQQHLDITSPRWVMDSRRSRALYYCLSDIVFPTEGCLLRHFVWTSYTAPTGSWRTRRCDERTTLPRNTQGPGVLWISVFVVIVSVWHIAQLRHGQDKLLLHCLGYLGYHCCPHLIGCLKRSSSEDTGAFLEKFR